MNEPVLITVETIDDDPHPREYSCTASSVADGMLALVCEDGLMVVYPLTSVRRYWLELPKEGETDDSVS